MQIGEIARRAGMSVRAVRYYEELDLIQPDNHSSGGFRLYSEKSLKRLRVIDFLKGLGLSLTEIRKILRARKASRGNLETVRELLRLYDQRLTLIDEKIRAMSAMRAEIAQVVEILRSCQSCDRGVLLDTETCTECANLVSRGSVPETFEVLLS
jgi:DNA-binding transcriptional MerR regulator